MILGLGSSLYNNLIIAAWIYFVFRVFLEFQVAVVPFLWAYTVATVPFGFMAMKEQDNNSFTNLFLFMIQITSIAFGIAGYAGAEPSDLLMIAGIFVGVATAVNALLMFMARAALRDESVEL